MTEELTFEQLSDFDMFFYYGQNDLESENASDLLAGLLQSIRSMFYNRSEGIDQKENYPNTLILTIGLKYSIINYVGYRNTQVGDGTNNTKDRRIAASQDSIKFDQDNQGNLDVTVYYISFVNYNELKNIKAPV